MRTAMVVLSDTGQPKLKRSVPLNDMRAISEIYKAAGSEAEILYREDLENKIDLNEFDNLFVFYGGLINFGGLQSEHALAVFRLINSFNGTVVVFDNDVLDPVNNKKRQGFERITRSVVYASPEGIGGSERGTIDLDVSKEIEINQSFVIGKRLSKMEDVATEPMYDVVYGGRNRPAMKRRLQEISKHKSLIAYSGIIDSLDETDAKLLKARYNFNNAQLRVINSLGKYSLMLKEKNKNYFTSRVFEQLFSNSIVLFDRQWKTFECFWNKNNTFDGSVEDLVKKVSEPYSADRVKVQHEMARSFDFDGEINKEAEELALIIR